MSGPLMSEAMRKFGEFRRHELSIFFNFSKIFFCSYGGFPKAQNAPSRIPGDCFLMPIRSDWGRYAGETLWVYTVKDLTLTGMVTGQKMGTDTSVRTG